MLRQGISGSRFGHCRSTFDTSTRRLHENAKVQERKHEYGASVPLGQFHCQHEGISTLPTRGLGSRGFGKHNHKDGTLCNTATFVKEDTQDEVQVVYARGAKNWRGRGETSSPRWLSSTCGIYWKNSRWEDSTTSNQNITKYCCNFQIHLGCASLCATEWHSAATEMHNTFTKNIVFKEGLHLMIDFTARIWFRLQLCISIVHDKPLTHDLEKKKSLLPRVLKTGIVYNWPLLHPEL